MGRSEQPSHFDQSPKIVDLQAVLMPGKGRTYRGGEYRVANPMHGMRVSR